jgi:hypothetical protein
MAAAKRAVFHPSMKKALALAPAGAHPKSIHAGGPAVRVVKFEGPACLSIAAWQTGLLASTLADGERARFDKWMKMACDSPQPSYNALGVATPKGSPALIAASHCVSARGAMAGGYDSRADAADITELVIRHLGTDAKAIERFISELDDRLMAYELGAAARVKGGRDFAVFERVLWRGGDAKGDCVTWVARVRTGVYSILSKVGARWRWAEGTRDDTLASVPDGLFAAATREAFARDTPLKVTVRLPKRGKDKENFWTVDVVDR